MIITDTQRAQSCFIVSVCLFASFLIFFTLSWSHSVLGTWRKAFLAGFIPRERLIDCFYLTLMGSYLFCCFKRVLVDGVWQRGQTSLSGFCFFCLVCLMARMAGGVLLCVHDSVVWALHCIVLRQLQTAIRVNYASVALSSILAMFPSSTICSFLNNHPCGLKDIPDQSLTRWVNSCKISRIGGKMR